jgi:hypothetical protein
VARIIEMEQPILADWIKERDDPRVARTKAEEETAGAGCGRGEPETLKAFSVFIPTSHNDVDIV